MELGLRYLSAGWSRWKMPIVKIEPGIIVLEGKHAAAIFAFVGTSAQLHHLYDQQNITKHICYWKKAKDNFKKINVVIF